MSPLLQHLALWCFQRIQNCCWVPEIIQVKGRSIRNELIKTWTFQLQYFSFFIRIKTFSCDLVNLKFIQLLENVSINITFISSLLFSLTCWLGYLHLKRSCCKRNFKLFIWANVILFDKNDCFSSSFMYTSYKTDVSPAMYKTFEKVSCCVAKIMLAEFFLHSISNQSFISGKQ